MAHPFPKSLGDLVCEWIERHCVHGPGDVYGQPVRLTHEEQRFLEAAYAIDPASGRRTIDLAAYVRRKGTRKSELGAWLVAAECLGPVRAYMDGGEPIARPPVDPDVKCIATTEDQGDLVYGAFRAITKASASLDPRFDVGLEVTYLIGQPGKVELLQSRNAAALDGARPTFEVMDEPHLWLPMLHETFATARRNLRKRHAAMPWAFLPSTAYEPGQDSVMERLHDATGRHENGQRIAGRTLVDWRQAAVRWELAHPEQLRAAVEEAGGDAYWGDTEAICAEWSGGGAKEPEFRRYWLNQPVQVDVESWLPAGAWEGCRGTAVLLPDTPTWVGLDFGYKHDTCAVVAVQRHGERLVATAKVWVPGEGTVDVADVEKYLRDLHRDLDVHEVAYDPAYFLRSAQVLADDGLPMLEFPQSPQRMVPACMEAHRLITDRVVLHDFDPVATAHINQAVTRTAENGWRLSKQKSTRKIDTAIALVIALARAGEPAPKKRQLFVAVT